MAVAGVEAIIGVEAVAVNVGVEAIMGIETVAVAGVAGIPVVDAEGLR